MNGLLIHFNILSMDLFIGHGVLMEYKWDSNGRY